MSSTRLIWLALATSYLNETPLLSLLLTILHHRGRTRESYGRHRPPKMPLLRP